MNCSASLVGLAALLLVASVVVADDAAAAIRTALSKCASDNGLSSEALKKACDGVLPSNVEPYKCYTKCVQQTVGIMKASGEVDPEEAAKTLVDETEREVMRGIAKECLGEDTANLCDKAFSVDQCYSSKNKAMYRKNCNKLMIASGLA